MAEFFLGTHEVHWLRMSPVPLFVSRVRLEKVRRWQPAVARWAMDSGGFSALSKPPHRWPITVEQYAEQIERASVEIGMLAWAAPMDSMCEPQVLAGTGKTVTEHQVETVERFCHLRSLATVYVPPVLQGWEPEDYWRCAEMYREAGVDLLAERLVGVGTVCRRQATTEIGRLIAELSSTGMRLHGFGVKLDGLARYGRLLSSADSMAWSYGARKQWEANGPDPDCPHGVDRTGSCSNCLRYALRWRADVIRLLDRSTSQPQLALRSL